MYITKILCLFLVFLLLSIELYSKTKVNIEKRKIKPYLEEIEPDAIRMNLENALSIGITNNFELKAIKSQKTLYSLAIDESWRNLFPTLTLAYMQMEESSKRETDSRQHIFSVDSEILIYDGGKKKLAYDVSKLKALLARNDYRIALNQLIMEIYNIFFEVLLLRDSISVYEKTLENGWTQLDFIGKELSLGEATRFEVIEIETKVKEIELNLEKTKNDYETALNKLKLVLKVSWRYPVLPSGDIDNSFIIKPIDDKFTFDYLVDIAIKNRKEIESADIEHSISKRTYMINKLYYFPQFSFGLNYSLTDEKYFPREKGWGVNFKVSTALWGNTAKINSGYSEKGNSNTRAISNSSSVNILDNMDYKRNKIESKINLNTANEKKKDIREQIAIEVTTYLMALKNSWSMIGISRKQLELYDNQLVIERLKANMGEARRYDLIKKEIERGQAAIAYLTSLVRYLISASTLEISLGVDVGFFKTSQLVNSHE
ncbi:MAG: TolC family protein [Spirochaetes bacterium]|nr:TolC family protein [Spirochaetota bacterium]